MAKDALVRKPGEPSARYAVDHWRRFRALLVLQLRHREFIDRKGGSWVPVR